MKVVNPILLALTVSLCSKSFAQELNVIGASGNYTEGTTHSVAWTIGEVVTATLIFPGNHVTQGFHQPCLAVATIQEYQDFNISVYPNPARDIINVMSDEDAVMTLIDLRGRIIQNYNVNSITSEIDVSYLERGTYMLIFDVGGNLAEKMKIVVL
jgi:hypothetical protein